MLFLCYWELNEAMPATERLAIGQKLTSSGMFPGKLKMLRWDATPDLWGISLFEADSAAEAQQFLDMWRFAGPGFFKTTRLAPATPVVEWMERSAELLKKMPR